MLKLRRGTVAQAGPADGGEQQLTVLLAGGRERPAVADVGLVGPCEAGDEVVVNVQALDLRLGSGGFDVVHANLTRGLEGEGLAGAHVMKLNYTPLQHAVLPVEAEGTGGEAEDLGGGVCARLAFGRPAAVLALHGQLAPLAWAFAQSAPDGRLGFVQTAGGALPGGHSRVVREMRARGLLAGHITAGAAYGGEQEAISVAGALHQGFTALGWDAAVCAPGPGIVGSGSALGHGGMQALDSLHTALALGCEAVLVPRMSCADPRPRHRPFSHHTLTVLGLLLKEVVLALPGKDTGGADDAWDLASALEPPPIARHERRQADVDLHGYRESGLPARTMGRTLDEDPLFFAAALAGGTVLAELAAS